jgi:hypothetical protein
MGLNARAELGATFGYQWRDGSVSTSTTADADGVIDLTISPKVPLWEGANNTLKLGARVDLKVPTASESRGLGTGNADEGLS